MHKSPSVLQESSSVDKTTKIITTIADSFSLSRLPAFRPTTFSDEPIHYPDWKLSFYALIHRKNLPLCNKTYYLQPYASGSAKQAISRGFVDFLTNIETAMQTIKDLAILNDYMENQKLLAKLPDWLISRWNREGKREMIERKRYPDFKTFMANINAEAEANPILSLLVMQWKN